MYVVLSNLKYTYSLSEGKRYTVAIVMKTIQIIRNIKNFKKSRKCENN